MRTKPVIALASILAACALTLHSPASYAEVAELTDYFTWDIGGGGGGGSGGGDYGGGYSGSEGFAGGERYGSGELADYSAVVGDLGFEVIVNSPSTEQSNDAYNESAGLNLDRPEAPAEVASTNPADVDLGAYLESLGDSANHTASDTAGNTVETSEPGDRVIASIADTDVPDESAGLDLSRPEVSSGVSADVASTNPADVDMGAYLEQVQRNQEAANQWAEQDSAYAAFDQYPSAVSNPVINFRHESHGVAQ